jgi:hypothetical protein
MSIVTGLFLRFGRVIPAHQITPQLADELHSALAKVMMYTKANNVKLTSQQVRYIMEQTRQLDIYEGKGVEQVVKGPKADVIDLSKKLGPDAPYSAQNPQGWMPKEGEFKNTFNENLVKDTIDLFKSKTDNRSYQDELKKLMLRQGTYADYSADEIEAILKGIKTEPDPSGLKDGGRIGYSTGAGKKGVQGILDLVKDKFGKKSITTADKVVRPESATTRDMFKAFNERMKQKDIKKQSKETYERLKKEEPEIMAELDEMWEDPEKFAPNKDRLLTDDEIKEYEEVLGDSETWMTKGTLGEADEAIQRQIALEKQMYKEYKLDKQARKELEQAYKEIDFRMTGEDSKYEAQELADVLSDIRYQTEFYDLPQKTQIDLYGEAYDYLMDVKRDRANFKGAVNTKTGKNIFTEEQELPIDPMTGKPRKLNAKGGRVGYSGGGILNTLKFLKKIFGRDYLLKDIRKNDPALFKGLLEVAPDFRKRDMEKLVTYMEKYLPDMSRSKIKEMIISSEKGDGIFGQLVRLGSGRSYKATDDTFKEIEKRDMLKNFDTKDRKANAMGGRIGFSVGGIDKVRRALLKMFGGAAATGVAAKTGMFGLLKGKKVKDAAKVVERVKKDAPPAYVFDLVKIIRAKGKDITKQAQTIERETVKTYKGIDLYETPDGFRIRTQNVGPYEGSKEIELMYSKTDEVKDAGMETQKSYKVEDYEEATVRPDSDGKLKDVELYVEDKDHKQLEKFVEEEKKKFKSGGLAYMLGE